MICRNCGQEINDGSVFCPHCGATTAPGPGGEPPAPYSASAPPAWEAPEKKKKTGLIIGIAVAAVAVVAVLAVVLGGLFSNPKKQMEAAFVKSAAAYAAAEEKLGLPDTEQWQKDQKITQDMSLELNSVNSELVGMDLSALSGLKLGLSASYSGAERWLNGNLWAAWGEDALLSLLIAADDAQLYFNSPQITGDTYYGVNTETFGADITKMSGDNSMENLSFNIFDLVDLVLEKMDQEAMEERFKQANKALWEQAKVKKTGARTLTLNGTETKTTAYQVVIPQEALYQYVDDLETVLSAFNYYNLYRDMFQSMGLPQESVQDFLDELEGLDPYGELADGLRQLVAELGDVELEVCLSGGYVSAVRYEGRAGSLSAAVYLGGGEEYVDDLSAEVKVNGTEVTVQSAGDHGLRGGVYTDETTIRVRQDSATLARVTSELTLDPAKQSDNLQWKLGVDSSGLSICVLDMAGDMTWSRDYLSLNPVEISVRAVGMEVCRLSLSYRAENRAEKGTVEAPMLITRMSADELEQMVLDTQQRTLAWASEMQGLMMTRLPQELLWSLMSLY